MVFPAGAIGFAGRRARWKLRLETLVRFPLSNVQQWVRESVRSAEGRFRKSRNRGRQVWSLRTKHVAMAPGHGPNLQVLNQTSPGR